MDSNMKKIIVIFLCFIPALAFANVENIGYWSVKCGGFGGSVEIYSSDEAKININDNNLYISAHLVEDPDGKSKVFYRDVIESMNDVINWADISQSKPIAELSTQNGILHVSWKGFYDTKKKSYVWKTEPDFVVASDGGGDIKMKKCNFQ